MGSFCSKPGNYSGGDAVVSSRTRVRGGQQLGESVAQRPDPRAAAAEAAEQRRKAAQTRGTTAANPNRGRLTAQLEASKAAPRASEPRQEEQLVWD